MKPTFATTPLALVAVIGLSACQGGAGDAMKFIPDGANVIGGADVTALMASKLWTENKEMTEDGPAKEQFEAAKACNLGKETWKSVVFGADLKAAETKMVIVLGVDGIGKKENLDCIHGKIKEKSGDKDPWTTEEVDGKLTLNIDDGKLTGYVVNDNMLVVAGKDWAGSVKELIDGKGKAAVDGSLKEVLGRANTKANLWVAANVPSDMAQGPAAGLKDGVVEGDFSSGVVVKASAGFDSAETATKKAEEAKGQIEGLKKMAGEMVPATVMDSIKIEAKESAVHAEVTVTDEDITKLSEAGKKMMGGGM